MNANFTPFVSIIIPVYNGSNYIKEAIESALAQTYKNIEIIIVNDGSTDNTEEIIKEYNNKVRYFKKENGGVSTALNLAIKESKGEYISWLSHDDLYYPEKIQKQIETLSKLKDKNTIVYSNYSIFDENTRNEIFSNLENDIIKENGSKNNALKLLFSSSIHGCTLLIPEVCFRKYGFFNPKLKTTQDYDLWFKFLSSGIGFNFISDCLVRGRKHDKQDTNKKIKLCFQERRELFKKASLFFLKDIINFDNDSFKIVKNTLVDLKLKHIYDLLKILRFIFKK